MQAEKLTRGGERRDPFADRTTILELRGVTKVLGRGKDARIAVNEINLVAREGDTLSLAFPQRAGGARLYHCFPTRFRDRFAGEHAATRFLPQTMDWGDIVADNTPSNP